MKLNKIKKSASVNVLITMLSGIMLKGLSIILSPIVTRVLSPADYGLISTYNVWFSIIAIFIGLQLGGSVQNSIYEYDEKEIYRYYSNCMMMVLVSFIIVGLPTIIFAKQIGGLLDINVNLMYMLAPQAFGGFSIGFLSSKFVAEKKPFYNFLISLITTIISAVASITLIFCMPTDKYLWYIVGNALPNLIFGVAAFVYFVVKGKSFFKFKYWKFAIMFSVPLIFHSLSSSLMGSADRLMIKHYLGNEAMGLYAIAFSICSVVSLLWSGINSAIVPFYYASLESKDVDGVQEKVSNSNFLFFVMCGGFMMVAPEFVRWVYPTNYHGALDLFSLIILSTFFMSLYTYSGNYEFYLKKTKWLAVGTIFSGLLNIGLNVLFIPLWGMQGATLASCLSYLALFLAHEIVARFVVKGFPVKFYKYLPSIAAMIILAVISYFCTNLWYVRWPIAIVLGTALIIKIVKTRKLV